MGNAICIGLLVLIFALLILADYLREHDGID